MNHWKLLVGNVDFHTFTIVQPLRFLTYKYDFIIHINMQFLKPTMPQIAVGNRIPHSHFRDSFFSNYNLCNIFKT